MQFLVTIIIAISVFFALKKMLNNSKAHLQTKNSINGNEKAVKAKGWPLGSISDRCLGTGDSFDFGEMTPT